MSERRNSENGAPPVPSPPERSGLGPWLRSLGGVLARRLSGGDSDRRLYSIADAMPVLIWVSGPDKEGTYFNQAWLDFTGKPIEEQLGSGWLGLVHPEDQATLSDACMDAFRRRQPFTAEFRLSRSDGAYRWMLDTGTPRFGAGDEFLGFVGSCVDIDDRRRAELALRERDQRLRQLADNIGQFVWTADESGRATWHNRRWHDYTGAAPAEARGWGWTTFHHPEHRERVVRNYRLAVAAGRPWEDTFPLRGREGGYRWFLARAFPIRDERGAVARWFGTATDVTELLDVQAALESREAELELIAESTPLILTRCSRDLRYLYANRSAAALFGRTPEEVIGRPIVEVMGQEAFSIVRPYMERVLRGEPVEYEARLPYTAIGLRHVRVHYLPDRNALGEVVGWIASIVDVTEHRRAEAELRASEERYRAIVEGQGEMVCRFRPGGTILFANLAYARVLGRAPEDLIGREFWDFITEEDREDVRTMLGKLSPGSPEVHIENRLQTPEGTRWTLWTNRGLVFDEGGRATEVQSSGMDITDRKRLEQSFRLLADASEALASMVEHDSTLSEVAGLAVRNFADWCAVDVAGGEGSSGRTGFRAGKEQFALSREAVERLLGSGRAEISSIPGHPAQTVMCVPLAIQGRRVGAISFASAGAYTETDLSIAEDLARRVAVAIENARLYAELRAAARRKDEFLAMLAHELRNPLAPIRAGLDLLAMGESRQKETIGLMQKQVDHLVRLVDDLLDVSRIMSGRIGLRKSPSELAGLVGQSANFVRDLMDERRQELVLSLPEASVWLDVDPVRVVQIVENLLRNASRYTADGGRIELAAEAGADEILIRVSDNGMGIEPDLMPRLFEPFTQSSRPLDRAEGGLGVGLTLVDRLVRLHGGSVSAESPGPGRGSTFTVRLPAGSVVPRPREEQEARAASGPLRKRRILVVDDNVAAATMLSMLLGALGDHEVGTVYDGESALSEIERTRPEIVLLDIGLPGMNGYGVARTIRANRDLDAVVLVALTGYGQEEDRRKAMEAGFDRHLVKPAGRTDLEELLAG